MNPALAALYGTGMTKTASDASGEVDLNTISAADFLAAMEQEEQAEPELDLSQMSAQDLINLSEQLDGDADPEIEKMAASGELEHWDMVGRIMAHAYANEIEKTASEEEELFDISNLSAEQLMEALESGEFELEKVAGVRQSAAAALENLKGRLSRGGAAAKAWAGKPGASYSHSMRRQAFMGKDKASRVKAALYAARKNKGQVAAAAGLGAAGLAGVGAGGYALKRKHDQTYKRK